MSHLFRDLASCPGVGVGNPLFSHLYDSLNFDIPFVCSDTFIERRVCIPFFRNLALCPGVGVSNLLLSHLYDSLNFDIPFVCLFGHLGRKESVYLIF